MSLMFKVCLFLGIVFLVLFGLRFMLNFFVFWPSARIVGAPAQLGIAFQDVTLTTEDKLRLRAWYIPAPNSRAHLLFFHGNGGNISYFVSSIKIFHDLGLSVFIVDYRGYGQSEGKPTVKSIKLDALASWKWLTEEKKIPAEKIVVFGRSLGGAIAAELMKHAEPKALILESTFSSLAEMAPLPSFVGRFLIGGDFWNSAKTAMGLCVPVLCIHSPGDEVVPYRLGKRLYEAVASEKTFVEIQGDHNTGFMQSFEVYNAGLDSFLTKHFGKTNI